MNEEREDTPEQLPGQAEYRQAGFDIGAIVKWPFEDEQWLSKVLVTGLIGFIPIIGWLNGAGWLKACYAARRDDRLELPPAGFGYIGSGFQALLAFLPLLGVVVITQTIAALFSDVFLVGGLFRLVGGLAGLGLVILAPAVLYVHVRDADNMASLRVDRIKAVIMGKDGFVPYVMLLVAMLVATAVFYLGGVVCLGALFTMPLGWAIGGAALADFEREESPGS